jgi:hypothetical protein
MLEAAVRRASYGKLGFVIEKILFVDDEPAHIKPDRRMAKTMAAFFADRLAAFFNLSPFVVSPSGSSSQC